MPIYQKTAEKTLQEISSQEHPFEDDLLKRKEIAENLVNIIKNTKGPFVFNINSPYGCGKTFFLKRLKVLLQSHNIAGILYNSWESDWCDSPLTAIAQEIIEELGNLPGAKSELLEKTKETVAKTALPAVKAAAESLIRLTCPPAGLILDAAGKALENGKERNSPLEAYSALKREKENFKKTLCRTLKERPLVIIIDELDRCRPDYAVKTLETIKHFFNIPNIIFILAMDRLQIESAISVLYGKKIEDNSSEYLRKFIDYNLYLPEPDNTDFVELLTQLHIKDALAPFCHPNPLNRTYPISIFNSSDKITQNDLLQSITDFMKNGLCILFSYFNFSLRAQEQIIIKLKMFLSALDPKEDLLIPEILPWLICMHSFSEEHFKLFTEDKTQKAANFFITSFNGNADGLANSSFYNYARARNINPAALKSLQPSQIKKFFTGPIDYFFNRISGGHTGEEAVLNAYKYTKIINLLNPDRDRHFSFLRRAGFL